MPLKNPPIGYQPVSDKLSLANAVRKIEFKLLQLITKVGRRRIRAHSTNGVII